MRNSVDPSRKFELSIVATERAIDLYENFLGEIEGRFVVADHAVDVGRYGTLVTAHELFKTSFDAADGSSHELTVAGGGQISGEDSGNGGGCKTHNTGVLRGTEKDCFKTVLQGM